MLKPALNRSPSRRLFIPLWLVIGLCFACLSLGAYVAGQPDDEVSEQASFDPSETFSSALTWSYHAAGDFACRLAGREYCAHPATAVPPIEIVPDTHWSSYVTYPSSDDPYAYEPSYYEPIRITYDPYWPTSRLRCELCEDGWVQLGEEGMWSCYRGVYRLSAF